MSDAVPDVTLMHISDLHFGEIDPSTGDATVSPVVRRLLANTTLFDGVAGHHARGLQHLEQFWRILRTREPNAEIVVSGDITSCGGSQELGNADAFLSGTLNMPFGPLGLRFPGWVRRRIPGNHDHWPGRPVILGQPNASVASSLLSGYPYIRTIGRGSGRPIHLIAVNSDSDVRPRGMQRLLAIGSFQTQLVKATAALAKLTEPGIRVLVIHHSWNRTKGPLSMAAASRGALQQFLDQESISIILTGHMHTPLIKRFAAGASGSAKWPVWECRCGTTTQIDKISYAAKSVLGKFPLRSWPANSLLIHRISEDSAGTHWNVETFVRGRSGFVTLGSKGKKAIAVP